MNLCMCQKSIILRAFWNFKFYYRTSLFTRAESSDFLSSARILLYLLHYKDRLQPACNPQLFLSVPIPSLRKSPKSFFMILIHSQHIHMLVS